MKQKEKIYGDPLECHNAVREADSSGSAEKVV